MASVDKPVRVGAKHDNKQLQALVLRVQIQNLIAKGAVDSGGSVPLGARDGLLYFLVPKKDGRLPYSGPSSTKPRPHKEFIQNDYAETNPLACPAKGLVYICGLLHL